jgi:hypothetical protein
MVLLGMSKEIETLKGTEAHTLAKSMGAYTEKLSG